LGNSLGCTGYNNAESNFKSSMKANKLALFSFGLSLLGAGAAIGQTATTEPVGFTTINLVAGDNFVAFNLQPPSVYQGTVTVDSGNAARVFLTGATLTNDQFNGVPHTMELTSGGVADQGGNTVVVDTIASGSEVVLQSIIPGLVDGSTVRISKNLTIADAFGATNSAGLTSTTSSATSDLILIPTAAGGYDQYYYSAGGFAGTGWRRIGSNPGNTPQGGASFYYTDGFIILSRSAKSVTLTGSVKKGQTVVVLETGNNFVANLCPVNAGGANPSVGGRTLSNSNLYNGTSNGLMGGTSSGTADLVLFWNGTGYDQFYYSTGGFAGVGWRKIGSVPGNADQASIPLPDGAFLVLRRGAPTTVALSQIGF